MVAVAEDLFETVVFQGVADQFHITAVAEFEEISGILKFLTARRHSELEILGIAL